MAVCTGNALIQAMSPLLVAAWCWGQGNGIRREHCRLGHSGCCGGASRLLAALASCLKVISVDLCCYKHVMNSKNSSLYPSVQWNCVFMHMFRFNWGIMGSKSSFTSLSYICCITSFRTPRYSASSALSSCSGARVIPSCPSELGTHYISLITRILSSCFALPFYL